MTEQLKNVLIGFFIIAASSLLIWMLLFLHPSLGDGKQKLTIRFSNISQINVGTRVTLAGKPVGKVTEITTVEDGRDLGKTDKQGNPYMFQLVLAIDSKVQVYDTDQIMIETTGLLGEKSITIAPEVPPKGVTAHLIKPGEIIYAQGQGPIETVLYQVEQVGLKLGNTLDVVFNLLEDNKDSIHTVVNNLNSTLASTSQIFNDVEKKQIVTHAAGILENVDEITEKIDPQDVSNIVHNTSLFSNALADSSQDVPGAVQSIRDFTYEGSQTFANLTKITNTIAAGKGSIGRLVESEDFYLKLTAILSKVNTLMNDVNQYGVLFHLNKGWQRMRQQKIQQMNQLTSIEDFRIYLNRELDGVSASLARLNILLEKAQAAPEEKMIMESNVFKKDYIHLMQQVGHLDDLLKRYNEMMQDQK